MNEDAISRAAAISKVEPDEYYHSNEVKAMLEELPSVPPQVVHAHWDECDDDINAWIRCSACGFEQDLDEYGEHPHEVEDYKSCPSCGAIMDGGEDDAAR